MNQELGIRKKTKMATPSCSLFLLRYSRQSGFGLVEILITAALVSVVLIAFGQVAQVSLKLLAKEREMLEASFLQQEAFEGVRALRDAGWSGNISGLVAETPYYLTASTTWSLSASAAPYINGKYFRTIVFSPVLRDSSDRIAASGTNDSGTRKVTVTVAWWSRNATTSVSVSGYIADIHQN